jgi:PPK2 family polyphosphate:nucleotide phosphotransferase
MFDSYCVKPGGKFKLKDFNPDDTSGFDGKKKDGLEKLAVLNQELENLQETLYAEHKHKILIVLQAMDTGGKDGTIRKVFEGVNPQGVRVASFKVPTPVETDHDYLWRIHAQTPGKGEIVIFNRSHYEDVLVVRVHGLVPKEVWKKRYQQIVHFEEELAAEGTILLKFFLNISKEEQKQRLLERIDTPEKRWKFNPGDLKERELWDSYMEAYEDAIMKTSTKTAPWYVIPANRNWYRDLVITTLLVDQLKALKMSYPEEAPDLETCRKQLEAEDM